MTEYRPIDIAKYIHESNTTEIPRVDTDNIVAVEERINQYINSCVYWGIIPTLTGLACAIGVNRKTLYNWESGQRRGNNEEYKKIITRYKTLLESILESMILDNRINAPTGIFILKNHYGYQDKPVIVEIPKRDITRDHLDTFFLQLLKKYSK